jgi:hypothetical protein
LPILYLQDQKEALWTKFESSWSQFSPAVISDLCDVPIVQPQPTLSIHTQATSTWTMPMPQLNGIDFLIILTYYFTIYRLILFYN